MNLLIEAIDGGFRVSVPERRWTWWVYPDDHEIRNNGQRYWCKREVVAPRVTLPMNWSLGNVVDEIRRLYIETVDLFPPIHVNNKTNPENNSEKEDVYEK
jgi:hypothetical protein